MLRSAASLRISRSRSSRSAPSATYADLTGISGLAAPPAPGCGRPPTPARSRVGRYCARRRGCAVRVRRSALLGLRPLCAWYLARSSALGVGPRPPARGGPGRRNRRCCPCPCLPYGALALAVAWHLLVVLRRVRSAVAATTDQRGPCGVSETSMPSAAQSSRGSRRRRRSPSASRAAGALLDQRRRPDRRPPRSVVDHRRGRQAGSSASSPKIVSMPGDRVERARELILVTGVAGPDSLPARRCAAPRPRRAYQDRRSSRRRRRPAPPGLAGPTSSVARSTKLSIRASAVADSASEASEYSIAER